MSTDDSAMEALDLLLTGDAAVDELLVQFEGLGDAALREKSATLESAHLHLSALLQAPVQPPATPEST